MAADKQLTGVDWNGTWLHLQPRTVSCHCGRTGHQAYTAPAGPPTIGVYSLAHTHCTPHPVLPRISLSLSFGLSRRFIGLEVVCCVRVALHSGVVLSRRRRRRGSSSRPGQCKVKAGSSSQQRFSPAELNCQTQTGQRAAQPSLRWNHFYLANINHHSKHKKCHPITSLRLVLS